MIDPVAPYRLDATMNLWELKIPSYTFKPTDVTAVYLENKRYTMKDIGKMERRINNIEYYTALKLTWRKMQKHWLLKMQLD